MATGNLKAIYGGNKGINLNGLQNYSASGIGNVNITSVNIASSMTTVISLSGHFLINQAMINVNAAADTFSLEIIVDGVTVSTFTRAADTTGLYTIVKDNAFIECQSSFVVRAQKPNTTNASVNYWAYSIV